jgi:preprotein translocase subunit SecA
MRHFPVQLIGGMVLNDGRIAEMKTGEGKTLVATLSTYLNALAPDAQVHVVTVNDYLARRDASWMGKIYDFLGLSVGIIQNQASFYFKLGAQADEKSQQLRNVGRVDDLEDGDLTQNTVLDVENLVPCDRKRAYWDSDLEAPVDIVYGVNSEFGFDYLRDNMAQSPDDVVQRAGHWTAVVDEVDSILIDEARTPLIISSQAEESSDNYRLFARLVNKLNPELDYNVDEKRKVVTLTDYGVEKVERELGITSLYESEKNVVLVHHLETAIRAKALFKRDKEYVVKSGEIIIVDENTGRMMFGRRYNAGLHQGIEAKEGIEIKSENKTVASITFQNYFRLYKKLSGMTGTAATEAEEMFKIYKLLVVSIPTNRTVVRKDYVDYVFKTEVGKFQAVVREIARIHSTGQPILVGTTSIERNSLLCGMLDQAGVPYEVLNAKNHEQEARIISKAGEKGAVTIATNIAGRGVDIKLGGEKPGEDDKKGLAKWHKDHEEIVSLGGLFVIGTERHESRRVDNQLRGRSGRQGDPGETRFFVSLEDYIIRVFGGDRANYFAMLPIADDEAIEVSLLSKVIEEAQKKIEGQNYDVRKHVTDYDDIINKQRKVVYEKRYQVLFNKDFNWRADTAAALYDSVTRDLKLVSKDSKGAKKTEQLKDSSDAMNMIKGKDDYTSDSVVKLLKTSGYNYSKAARPIAKELDSELVEKWDIYQDHVKAAMARYVFLRSIDVNWTEHLVSIEHLQDSVRLRGYSQKDPLSEFKHEGMALFRLLLSEINLEVANTVFKVNPDLVPAGIMKK